MGLCRGLHVHGSALAAVIRIGLSCPRLDTAAVQVQNGCVTPRWIVRFGCIEVPIGPMSTRPGRNVDAGTAPEDLAHRVANRSSIQIWIRLSFETPVQFAAQRPGP